MLSHNTNQTPQCPSRHGDTRCGRPTGHGGPHRHDWTDEHDQIRVTSWTDRHAS